MNIQQLIRAVAASAALGLLATGCSSVKLDDPAPVTDASATKGTGSSTGADPRAVAQVDTTGNRGLDPFTDPSNPLSKRSIYFDFDSFVVTSQYQPVVETHGRYLAANKQRRVVVEGNTDNRGGREYNLALGQKRAEAVKSRLVLIGASDSQIDAVSFGSEKPKATGDTEEAWAQNRRADINYR